MGLKRKAVGISIEHLEDGRCFMSGGHLAEGILWNVTDSIGDIGGQKYLKFCRET